MYFFETYWDFSINSGIYLFIFLESLENSEIYLKLFLFDTDYCYQYSSENSVIFQDEQRTAGCETIYLGYTKSSDSDRFFTLRKIKKRFHCS